MTALGPGVRVKCVKDDWRPRVTVFSETGPAKGTVWTVNWVGFGESGMEAIGLSEWPRQDLCFDHTHFVPLSGNEDISQLTALLDKWNEHTPTREDALVTGKVGA